MLTLGLGRSSMQVMPSVGSGRYSPGPGTVKLLEDGSYQEIRPQVPKCSLTRPVFLAIDSEITAIPELLGDRQQLYQRRTGSSLLRKPHSVYVSADVLYARGTDRPPRLLRAGARWNGEVTENPRLKQPGPAAVPRP